jgi:DNA-binding NarL/FixJ family response regulator
MPLATSEVFSMARRSRRKVDPIAAELESIKKLLILQLIISGVQAQSIGKVLGISKGTVSGMVPARVIKRKGA